MNRHLAAPKYICQGLPINLFTQILPQFVKTNYYSSLVHAPKMWTHNKPLHKVQMIQKSFKQDDVRIRKGRAFIKKEMYVGKIPTKARMIQGNPNHITAYEYVEEFTAIMALFKHLKDNTFEYQGVSYQFSYASGMNHNQIADLVAGWDTDVCRRLLDECDGKNWDATMQEPLLMAEAAVYAMLDPLVAKHCLDRSSGCWMQAMAYKHSPIFYFILWKRLSGDWNTSVGNTIISMMIRFYVLSTCAAQYNLKRVSAIFMGDDYLASYWFERPVCPVHLCNTLNQLEQSTGIEPKRGLFNDLSHVSFISLGFWPTASGYAAVPHPGHMLAKAFVSVNADINPRTYCHEMAVAFLPAYKGFHFMEAFFHKYLQRGWVHTKTRKDYAGWWHDLISDRIIKWSSAFLLKYGFSIQCMRFPDCPDYCVINHPLVDEMIRIEMLDPDERTTRLA